MFGKTTSKTKLLKYFKNIMHEKTEYILVQILMRYLSNKIKTGSLEASLMTIKKSISRIHLRMVKFILVLLSNLLSIKAGEERLKVFPMAE
ncbi:unnamed protein product, partial [Hymenolepis diminuta]